MLKKLRVGLEIVPRTDGPESLGILVATYVGIRLQIGSEEAYLLQSYGDEYRAYARSVGRFVPWIGRLEPGARGIT